MQIPDKVDLADQHSSESISGVPIKKRLFRLSWCSSSTTQETCTVPHDCNGEPKKFSCDAESSASENGADVVVETNIEPDHLQGSPFTLSDQRSYCQGELETSFLHGNPTQVYQFRKVKSALKESNMMEDVNTDSRLSLDLDVGKQKQFVLQQECEMLVDTRTVGVPFALCDVSASKRVETTNLHQSSCEDERYHGLNLSKQVKVETCSLDIPQSKGMQNHQTTNDDLHTSVNSSAHLCVNREKWDLNVPMEVWEPKHDMNVMLKLKNIHQHKNDKNLIQTTGATVGNKLTSGSSMVEVSQCNIRPKNLGLPADDSGGYEAGLDLQLRPPGRPDLLRNLRIASLGLSLSLKGSILDASIVKPEPLENGSPKKTETPEFSSVKPVAKPHFKLERCDGSSHGKASKVPVQDSLPDIMVKTEPLEEFHGKSPNTPLDNKQSTTCHTEVPQNLNSNAFPTENILCDNSSAMPGNANIKSVESSYLALDLDPSTVSGPKIPAIVADASTDDCVFQDAEGSTSKFDIIVGSNLSDVRSCDKKDREINKIVDMTPSVPNKSMASDLGKQKTFDGLSEGSADMDCSAGEYYTSPKLIAGENLNANPGNCSEPNSGSQVGIDIQQVHMQQVGVNEEHLGVSYGQTCVRTKVTSPGVGEVKVGDGDPGTPVLQTATDVSCDYEENRVLQCANEVPCFKSKVIENSTVDFVGSECCDPMMDIHVDVDTKEKEKFSVEPNDGHNAKRFNGIMCNDKKGRSCKLTASHRARFVKPCRRALNNHFGKKKDLDMQSSPKEASAAIAKTNKGYVGRSQMNSRYAGASTKHPEWQERDSDVSDTANRHFYDVSKHVDYKYADNKHKYRDTEKSSPPPIRSLSHRIPISATLVSSGTENRRWIDKQKRDQLCTQRRRPSKFDSTYHEQPIGRFESDYMNTRRNDNRQFVRDPNIQYEDLNDSRKYQVQRLNEGIEVPFNLPPNGSIRIAGRLSRTVDDTRHYSHFPSWRQLQGPPLKGPIREIVPDRFIGGEVHDDILVHEEKIMNLPDAIVDDDLLYSRSNLQYDPTDHDFLSRGRSSPPTQRRPHPLQMYRSRSPCQWSSPGITPEMSIDNHNHPEPPIRHGPPVMRVEMARSHPHPCFPEDMMVRRNVSPPYTQFPVDMREVRPVNEFVLPRPSRIMQRNIRSSDLDPHEIAECIGPSHFTDQFVDCRDYHNRRGLAQRLRLRPIPGHDMEDSLPYPDDDGCLRPINFCSDDEVIPAKGKARNYDNHVKNRLGPAPNRLRSKAEQGEDYRYHGRQGWRDGGYSDGRLKRRKF